MTVLEFWGGTLIAFGPPLAMFSLTVAHDPIKVILLISSCFFWLMSFLIVAICWSIISMFCDYLVIGAYLAVLSQEAFRYLFYVVTNKAQLYLSKLLDTESNNGRANKRVNRTNEIQISNSGIQFQDRLPLSYVSGLGFGLMNAAFSLLNVLSDYIGPGTVGLRGESAYFLLVSSLTALAFVLLNVSWSIILSESIEKSDKKLASMVLISHLIVTTITFVNRLHLQLISIIVIYSVTAICGLRAFKMSGFSLQQLVDTPSSSVMN